MCGHFEKAQLRGWMFGRGFGGFMQKQRLRAALIVCLEPLLASDIGCICVLSVDMLASLNPALQLLPRLVKRAMAGGETRCADLAYAQNAWKSIHNDHASLLRVGPRSAYYKAAAGSEGISTPAHFEKWQNNMQEAICRIRAACLTKESQHHDLHRSFTCVVNWVL